MLMALSLGAARARDGLGRQLKRLLPHMQRIASGLPLIAGACLTYYWALVIWAPPESLGDALLVGAMCWSYARNHPSSSAMIEPSVSAMFSLPAQSRRWELGNLLVVGAALLSVGAAAIHFAVGPEHFREYWGFGVFFVVVAWLQLAFAAAALVRAQRAIVVGAAIGNALVVVIWIVSRTIGIPLGPEPGTAESATVIDLMATAFELVIVVCCIGSLASRIRGRQLPRSVLTRLVIVAVAVVIALTTWAVAAPTREGTTHGHHSDAEHGRKTGQVLNPGHEEA
jgi:hypothetical protein